MLAIMVSKIGNVLFLFACLLVVFKSTLVNLKIALMSSSSFGALSLGALLPLSCVALPRSVLQSSDRRSSSSKGCHLLFRHHQDLDGVLAREL